ncbi:hypothetical protein AC249_AIPGENE28138 [Exaiptasia diaphana]|nr:hypothetical protein AC249_AIPGENE28138 [Exaiptasia diaphana]
MQIPPVGGLCLQHKLVSFALIGDFNPNATGLCPKDITQTNTLKQLVNFKTRDTGTLDWFLTNRPTLFSLSQLPKIGSSDHYTILAKPTTLRPTKSTIIKFKTRDTRDSAWRAFGRWITHMSWERVLKAPTSEGKYSIFMSELYEAMNTFLPERSVKRHPTYHPWITNRIKAAICKRQTAILHHGKDSSIYKFWRCKVQHHNILMGELRGLEVSLPIISWIAGFLSERQQAVRIEGTISEWKILKGVLTYPLLGKFSSSLK